MWEKLVHTFIRRIIARGQLDLTMPSGAVQHYGDGSGDRIGATLHSTEAMRSLVLNPELGLGESYMRGALTVEDDDIDGLLALIISNVNAVSQPWWRRPIKKTRAVLRRTSQINPRFRSRRNVAHHYDLSGQLYDQFLDHDRQYSCAYFRHPDDPLEQAQEQKKEHIARKLLLEPEMRVLDIGCGWGGLALYLARRHGVHVLGITLSKEQFDHAKQRAASEELDHLVNFRLCDYREVEGEYDRVVSVGMFEHVGLPHFDHFFATVKDRLAPNGVALVHTIGWSGPPSPTNPWIGKYIFPGGYIPTMSETMTSVEKSRLWATDVECWRLHYAYTLRNWRDRFEANVDAVRDLYDEEFVHMWRFYLSACEQTFRHSRQEVFQFQLSKQIDAVPITRDYLYSDPHVTRSLRAAE